ncbi:MAG: response regulator [Cyanobacteria bacterium J06560_6]
MLPEQQQRIMGYFIEEAKDHLNTIEQGLLSLQATIEDPEKANELFRAAHSVKGGAAMLGLESIQTTAHRMEDYFKILKESPVRVDSALETMFLRISDGLKDLLEQLEGPFGLTQEKAQEIMSGVDPVFGQLQQHLDSLVSASAGEGSGEAIAAEHSATASAATADALQTSFKKEVPALLRQLLTTFKQTDTAQTRQAAQDTCRQLHAIGERFNLSEWCDQVETARLAIENTQNEYRVLAPVLIKEIKKSQDLILAGRACEVAVAEAMQSLLPDDILATTQAAEAETTIDTLAADGLTGEEEGLGDLFGFESDDSELSNLTEFGLTESNLNDAEYGDSLDLFETSDEDEPSLEAEAAAPTNRLSVELDFNEIPSELSALNRNVEAEEKADESLDALLATVNVTGPDVGTEELNSLADLFDGDLEELDNTLGGHPFVSEEMRLNPEKIDLEEEDDFSDLLADDNLSDLVEVSQNSTDNDDELDDDLFGGTLTEGGFADIADLNLEEETNGEDKPENESSADLFGSHALDSDVLDSNAAELSEDIWGENAENEESTADAADDLLGSDISEMGELFDEASNDLSDDAQLTDDLLEEISGGSSENEALRVETPEETSQLENSESFLDELNYEEDNSSDLESVLPQVVEPVSATAVSATASEETEAELPIPTLSGGLFASETLSPSEQEIEFPTLTGVQLAKAEQDIESFFLDDLGSEELSNEAEDTAHSDSIENQLSTEAQLSDDPWGELSLAEPEEQTSEDAIDEINFASTGGESVEAVKADLNAEEVDSALEDLFETSEVEAVDTSDDFAEESQDLWDSVEPWSEEEAADEVHTLDSEEEALDSEELDFTVVQETPVISKKEPVTDTFHAEEATSDLDDLFEEDKTPLESDSTELEDQLSDDSGLDDLFTASDDENSNISDIDDLFGSVDDLGEDSFTDESLSAGEDDFPTLDGLSSDSVDETISTLNAEAENDLESAAANSESDDFSSLDFLNENELIEDTAQAEEQPSVDESLDQALEEASQTIPEAEFEDFDDLDLLLAEEGDADDSEDLGNQLNAQTAVAEAGSTPVPGEEDEDFDDLERLLEDGNSENPPTLTTRRPASRTTRRSGGGVREQNMRVPVKHLDNLSNLVGELVVSRNTLERDQERLRQFLDNLLFQVQQLNDVGQRMRDLYERSLLESSLVSSRKAHAASNAPGNAEPAGHATGATFDALEMDRFTGFHTLSQEMIELIVRVRESSSDIGYTVESSDQVTRQFRQITTQLQEGLNTARMVSFSQAADRLPRAVRDISLKCGKEAQLIVEGKDTLIDKMIVEHLYDPLTHLVNNAITHGIETPEERRAAGKSPAGSITVQAFYQGNQTVIYVADDGGGINPAFVQRKAVEKKLITQTEADGLSDIETYELLFHPGFSTRDQADDFAGRGVGMDVVRTSLAEIRGAITIDSEQGKGTSFTIRLPLTLSISKALSCVSNQARIAFPMDGVEDMLDVPADRIVKNEQGQDCVKWRDRILPFQAVTELLKFNRTLGRGRVYGGSQEDDVLSIIVLRSANTFVAIQVDQVIGEEEIVIKQLEGPVPKPLGIAGATILGDGRVMPIADVLELIDIAMGRVRRDAPSMLWADAVEVEEEEAPNKADPTVLIVDDSITVRELLSMSFNKVGYRVEQARDGQEAWDKLRSGLPCDLVFCDIEMPRMDGLELLSRMQKDNHLKQVPIAMLTSRGADRHRQMAVDLGASGYFTKPYLEEALLDAAQRMLNGETLAKGRGG